MFTEQMLHRLIDEIPPVSFETNGLIQDKLDKLTKPQGSLGFLENAVKKIGAIQETVSPEISNRRVYTFAGDHGIAQEGVSAYPASVTPQMVLNFLNEGAAINVLSKQFDTELRVVDVGVNYNFGTVSGLIERKVGFGTKNFLHEPAMTRAQAIESIFIGFDLVKTAKEEGVQLLIAGDMGIGNTSSSSAITAVICEKSIEEVTGIGTGVSDEQLMQKMSVLKEAIAARNPNRNDPLDILMQVGGFEIGAIAGAALSCAYHKIPLISDGFISTAGVSLGYSLCSVVRDVLFPVECNTEIGNKHLLEFLNLNPVLSLDVRLGEGTGAALFIPMLDAAINLYNNMATFGSAGVDNRD